MLIKSNLILKLIETNYLSLESIFANKGKVYSFLNPVSYLEALKHKDLFSSMDGLFSDGGILVLFIRIFYWKRVIRKSFDMTSLAKEVFEYASKNKQSIYFIGSRQEQVESAIRILKRSYPEMSIIGFRNGYFESDNEQLDVVKRICELNPDFLIVGLGNLRQEKFLNLVQSFGFKGIGFSCGGFLHQTAKNKVEYYPQWVDKYNLRFVYRMVVEKHTRKRYLKAAFIFPLKFIKERFCG